MGLELVEVRSLRLSLLSLLSFVASFGTWARRLQISSIEFLLVEKLAYLSPVRKD